MRVMNRFMNFWVCRKKRKLLNGNKLPVMMRSMSRPL